MIPCGLTRLAASYGRHDPWFRRGHQRKALNRFAEASVKRKEPAGSRTDSHIMAEPKKRRTWIYVVVGILISLFVIGIALIGSAIFYVRRHVSAQFVAAETAAPEFERARSQFAGQEPLIELRGDHDAVVHRRTGSSRGELQTLRVLAFDPQAEKLVRVSVPFWLIRMMPGRRLHMGTNEDLDFDTDRLHFTVDDLERAGPGLVIDGISPRGGSRILIWTE